MKEIGIFLLMLSLVLVGCVSSKVSMPEEDRIRKNSEMVQLKWDQIDVGSELKVIADDKAAWSGPRVVRFSTDEKADTLWAQLKEPTYTALPGRRTDLLNKTFGGRFVNELLPDEVASLRGIWSDTLKTIFLSDTFEVNAKLLSRAVQDAEVHVYYVLVGRYNAAETGHVDGALVVVTDARGTVIAKIRKSKVLLYPYRFIDTVAKTDKYLF